VHKLPSHIADILCPPIVVVVFALGMELRSRAAVIAFVSAIVSLGIVVGLSGSVREFFRVSVKPDSLPFLGASAASVALLPILHISAPYLIYVETSALVLSVTLLAFSITLELSGLVDLGVGAFVGIGAYVAVYASMQAGIPVLLTPILGAMVAAFVAKAISFAILRTRGHYFALVTFGFGLIVYNLFIQATALTGGVDGVRNIPGVDFPNTASILIFRPNPLHLPYELIPFYWVLCCLVIVFVFVLRLRSGNFGRCLRASRDTEPGATACGIDVLQFRSWAYTVGGAIAGFSGALIAHTVNYIAPSDFGMESSIYYFVVGVLGGFGRPLHSLIAAFLMIFLEEKLREFKGLRMLLLALAIIGIVLYRARAGQDKQALAREV